MAQQEIPSFSWASSLETRDGTLTKDAKMVNCFVEKTSNGVAIVKRPGSAYVSTNTGTPQGQFNTWYNGASPASSFYIVNNTIYEYGNPSFSLAIPTTASGYAPYSIVSGPSLSPGTFGVYAILQNVGFHTWPPSPGGGLWVFNGATLTPAGGSYPINNAVPGIAVLNGITYLMTYAGNIQGSAFNDPTTWPALDFIGPIGAVGVGMGVWRHLNFIVAYYSEGIQVYYDANAAPNGQGIALGPVSNASWSTGLLSYWSLVELNDVTFFLAEDTVFGRTIQAMIGLQLQKISTPFVEKILDLIPINTAGGSFVGSSVAVWASGIRIAGHSFYVITLADLGITLAYDVELQLWQQWSSVVGGVEQYFTGRYYINSSLGNYIQDLSTGRTMQMEQNLYTDATGPIPVTCVTKQHDWGSLNWKRFASMTQLGDTATSSTNIQVSFTDDDYNTFSTPRNIDMSTVRKQLRNCGSSRRRAWKMFYEDNYPLRLWEMELDMIGLKR